MLATGPRRDLLAERPGLLQPLALGRDLVDEAELQGTLGCDDLAGQGEAADGGGAEAGDEALRARPARHHADAGLRQAELGLFLGDADVGGGGKLQPSAERMAIEGGHQRHPQARQPVEDTVAVAHPVLAHLQRRQLAPGRDPPGTKPLPSPVDGSGSPHCHRSIRAADSPSIIASSGGLSLSGRAKVLTATALAISRRMGSAHALPPRFQPRSSRAGKAPHP